MERCLLRETVKQQGSRSIPRTPISSLEEARKIGIGEGLRYVYITNLPGHVGAETYCANCKKAVVNRAGFETIKVSIKKGRCAFWGSKIEGIWEV